MTGLGYGQLKTRWFRPVEPVILDASPRVPQLPNPGAAAVGIIFFGFETLLRGWLLFKPGFLPRFLGVLSMIGGIGWLTFLWPPLGSLGFTAVALSRSPE